MNEELKTNASRYCRACDARLTPAATKCWLCGRVTPPMPAEETVVAEVVPEARLERPHAHRRRQSATQFSLASLMLFVTLSGVLMGLTVMYPGVGITLSAIALPALIRTWIISFQAVRTDTPLSTGERIAEFAISFAGFAVIAVVCSIVLGVAVLVMAIVNCQIGVVGSFSGSRFGSMWWIPAIGVLVAGMIAVCLYRLIFGERE
jgi:hypothetical protein